MKYALLALLVATSLCCLVLGGLSVYATWLAYGWTYYAAVLVCLIAHYGVLYLMIKEAK